ncbi:MAG: cytochrome b/b6 domain-containing protein [Pseudomonadota bacterium]
MADDSPALVAEPRYHLIQRVLHWTIAALVLCALAGGALLYTYGFSGLEAAFGLGATNLLYKYHKTAGVLILCLMLLRLVVRLTLGAPAQVASIPPGQARIAEAIHLAFYGLLIAMAVLGWLATAAGGFPVEFFDAELPPLIGKDKALSETLYFLHGIVGLAMALLVALHIGAALRHWLVLRDGVMRRIGLP